MCEVTIRLSGGPERHKFAGFPNKKSVEKHIRGLRNAGKVCFVQSNAHWIVVPNDVLNASDTARAQNPAADVLTLRDYEHMSKWPKLRIPSRRNGSRRKSRKVSLYICKRRV